MVDAELAPLHDKIKIAITENSNLPIKYPVDTHFHGEYLLPAKRGLRSRSAASEACAPRSPAAETASGESESLGIASIYSDRQTPRGEIMDAGKMTAAHRTLPFGTHVTPVNRGHGRSVVVRINDRGPFVRGRMIDLSPAAGRALNIDGLACVSLIVGDADASHANEHLAEPVAQEEGHGPVK
jgi:rare lipoprotein A